VSEEGVLAPAHVFFVDPHAPLFASQIDHDAQYRRTLERLARGVSGSDPHMLSIAARSVGEGLHELSLEHSSDLIAVGACSRGPVARLAMGDDARSVLEHASCPVAVAPAGYSEHPTALCEIGVAYDGSPESEGAIAVARRLAATREANVHPLHEGPARSLLRGGSSVDRPIDLLVIGARQYGWSGQYLHPGKSRRLARPRRVPVLVVAGPRP
jgi:nucleotide-binding universal stress UspA family protein